MLMLWSRSEGYLKEMEKRCLKGFLMSGYPEKTDILRRWVSGSSATLFLKIAKIFWGMDVYCSKYRTE
jgi:hypothetical protein